jgi:protein-ribulosamine 3-kinase
MNAETLAAEVLRLAGDITQLHECTPLGGGSISQVLRLRSDRGRYVLKYDSQALPSFFAAEARGLALLEASGAVRVPKVLTYRDEQTGGPSFILLERLSPPPAPDRQAAALALGAGLAALHRVSAPSYGLDHDNYLGTTVQPNGWMSSWLEFFRERRLRFQADLARRNGWLAGERARRMERLLARLGDFLDERVCRPALLHGDLWSGNFILGPGNAPALIDPAVYYGDREAEVAFTSLFGGFPEAFYEAYETAWPLSEGWRERRDLYNLYHLLNHLNLFGESYGAAVDATLRRYAG